MDKAVLIEMLREDLELEVNAEASYQDLMFIASDRELLDKLAIVLNDTRKHIIMFSELISLLEKDSD